MIVILQKKKKKKKLHETQGSLSKFHELYIYIYIYVLDERLIKNSILSRIKSLLLILHFRTTGGDNENIWSGTKCVFFLMNKNITGNQMYQSYRGFGPTRKSTPPFQFN